MNSGPLIALGVLATIASAWLGLSFVPYAQVSDVRPVDPIQGATAYPRPTSGLAERGREVYIANGCAQCHSQKTRAGGDVERGWGVRASVAQDYQYDKPPLLGSNRIGPDLANIGSRQSDPHRHYRHLYYPQGESPGSNMPSFRHLFVQRKIANVQPSDDKIKTRDKDGNLVNWDLNQKEIPDKYKPAAGYEIVLGDDAKALVAYLISLDHSQPLVPAASGD